MDTKNITRTDTDNIDYLRLLQLKEKYWQLLEQFPFPPPPPSGSAPEMLSYFKRKTLDCPQIGHYTNITVFEAANRIATDLIIINGLLQLTEEEPTLQQEKYTLRLGNRHEKGQGDFSIGDQQGEAFNVAPSFLRGKLSATLKKWRQEQVTLSYIFVNAEVADNLKQEKMQVRIVKVQNWQVR